MIWNVGIILTLGIFIGGMYFAIYHPESQYTTTRRAKMGKVTLDIRTIKAGNKCMAVAQVGGVTLQGPLMGDPVEAVQGLLWQMGPNQPQMGGQAAVGIALALEGASIDNLAALDPPAKEDKAGA